MPAADLPALEQRLEACLFELDELQRKRPGLQRNVYMSGKLAPHRIQALEAVEGWVWHLYEANWLEAFDHLKRFVKREKHARVSAFCVRSVLAPTMSAFGGKADAFRRKADILPVPPICSIPRRNPWVPDRWQPE
jgi:hypothetical protein